MSDDITEQQAEAILRGFAEKKSTVHTLFRDIIKSVNTIKTGNLTQEELGTPKLPVRTYQELALFSKDIYNDNDWADYFEKMAEIQTSSSLSKDAILLKLAVTTKKELADVSPKSQTQNKGWFKKKNVPQQM